MRTGALIILTFLVAALTLHASDLTGRVTDASTGEPLPYATIALASAQLGVISDASGGFRLETDKASDSDTIVISYVGYRSLTSTVAGLKKNGDVKLEPYVFPIEEVVITPLKVEEILREAYDRFYENHVHTDMATYGYYREQIFDQAECVRYGEAVFASIFYEEGGEEMSTIQPYLARSIDDSTFLKKLNGIFNKKRMLIPVGIDEYMGDEMMTGFKVEQYYDAIGEFFFNDGKDGFKVEYSLKESYELNGRDSYFINFDIKKKRTRFASGRMLIDKETYGIAAVEVGMAQGVNLTRLLLPPRIRLIMKIAGFGVDIADFEAKLYNRYQDGKWFIGQGMQIIKGGIARRGDWIRGSLHREFHAFHSKDYIKPTQGEQIEFTDQRVNDFSSDFWGNFAYSPIQPLQQQYIERIIARNEAFDGEVLSERVKAKLAEKE